MGGIATGEYVLQVRIHDRQALDLGQAAQVLEVGIGGDEMDLWIQGVGLKLLALVNHLARRAAAVVADPKDDQGLLQPVSALHLPGAGHILGQDRLVIAVRVRLQDARAIRGLPPAIADAVAAAHVVEVLQPRPLHKLRHLPGVAERVRQPARGRILPEVRLEEPLAKEQGACQPLAAGHVRVGFVPQATYSVPLPTLGSQTHPGELGGKLTLDRAVSAGLTLHITEVGVQVHQVHGAVPGAVTDIHRLGPGPEPVHINVRMADIIDIISARQRR